MSTATIITINLVLVAGVVLAVNGLLLWAIATQHRDHREPHPTIARRRILTGSHPRPVDVHPS
jgi:hypothetical protein